MSQVIKSFLGVFFITLLLVSGLSEVSYLLNAVTAKNYKTEIIAEIENSDYNAAVINKCIQQANENNYDIKITVYEEDIITGSRTSTTLTSANATSANTDNAYMAEVILEYKNEIPIFNISSTRQVRGFAR